MTSPLELDQPLFLIQDTEQSTIAADTATDDGTGEDSGSSFMSFLPFILIGAVFWFLLIAPERKNRKRREVMLAQLGKGDEVMTNGGIYGTIAKIDGDVVTVKVADNVRLRFARSAIQMPAGAEPKELAKEQPAEDAAADAPEDAKDPA